MPASVPITRRRISIDRAWLRREGYLGQHGDEVLTLEALRPMRGTLLARALMPGALANARIILVTSALPREGRSFTALSLALGLSLGHDASVLLVDADRGNGFAARLGTPATPGLADLLADEALPADAAIIDTDLARLSILSPGEARWSASKEVMAHQAGIALQGLLAQDDQRLIVIDAPPLLAHEEARALAAVAGQVLLLVRAGRTPRRHVEAALACLDGHPGLRLALSRAWVPAGHARRVTNRTTAGAAASGGWLSRLCRAATVGAFLAALALSTSTDGPYCCAPCARYLSLEGATISHYVEATGPCRASQLGAGRVLRHGPRIARVS
jgi:hypothetical protein